MTYKPPYTISEVLRSKSEGLTHLQIANRFGISSSRIGQIIKREKQQALSAERSAAIRDGIRVGNDIGKKLSISDLFCVLNLQKRPEAVLRERFNRQGITEFSLLDIMDFLIPIVENASGRCDYMPAYKVRHLAQILYASMIKALSALECGTVFRLEWEGRKDRLKQYLKADGGFCPYILNGRNPALSGSLNSPAITPSSCLGPCPSLSQPASPPASPSPPSHPCPV